MKDDIQDVFTSEFREKNLSLIELLPRYELFRPVNAFLARGSAEYEKLIYRFLY
jgi:hypothetical protein